MPWTSSDLPSQAGRVALVTGANSGLGLEIATQLTRHGAHVLLACRNAAKADAAVAGLRRAVPGADVEAVTLDLAHLASVAKLADLVCSRFDRLDLLINNAGLMAVDRSLTADGFETQFGVNHLGHFALTSRLLPLLASTPQSRVATMTSMGHRAGQMDFDDLMGERRYRRWGAYFQSKLANLLFTFELQRRLAAGSAPAIAVAAHPGATRTDLGAEGSSWSNRALKPVVPLVSQSTARGALPMLRAATAPGVSGGSLWGPRWIVRGHPVLETPSRRARDTDAAARLWDASAQLTQTGC